MASGLLRKIWLLTSLYFAQGLPFGFFVQALPVLLRQGGASLPATSMASLLAIPWGLKFLWAPLVDRHHLPGLGRRRSWILPLQGLAVLTLLGLAWLRPTLTRGAETVQVVALLAGILLANLMAATQDIATDGFAVDLLDESERGVGNGVQVAGYRLGMIFGGGPLVLCFARFGWATTFSLMAGLLLLTTVPLWRYRERPAPEPPLVPPPSVLPAAARPPGYGAAALAFLRRDGALPWLAVLFLYKSGEALATGMLRTFLVDRHLDLGDVARIVGIFGSVMGLCGSLLGGVLVNRLGRRPALRLFGLLQALAVLGYALAAWRGLGTELLYVICGFEHLASGLATAALFTAMMDVSRPETGATDYTLQACVVVNATLVSAALSGFVAHAIGYPAHFAACAAVCLLGVACAEIYGGAWDRLRRDTAIS